MEGKNELGKNFFLSDIALGYGSISKLIFIQALGTNLLGLHQILKVVESPHVVHSTPDYPLCRSKHQCRNRELPWHYEGSAQIQEKYNGGYASGFDNSRAQ